MLDFSASMTANLDLLKSATEQFLLRMLPDGQGAGGRLQRQDPVQRHVHQRPRRPDRRARRPAVRQPHAPLRRASTQSIDELEGVEGRKVVLVFTDGDDTASRRSMGDVLRARARQGNDDLRHRPRVRVLQRRRPRAAHAAGPRPAQAGRRNRRRLLRAEEDRRPGAHLHPRRAGTAQPVHPRLHAGGARRQGAQARSADEAGRA